jgi:predicted metal-dependent peptidase
VLREKIEIAVAVDTSGSMSKEDLVDGVSEIAGICKAYGSIELTILSCDADVHTDCVIRDINDIENIQLKGGGGTDFRPVFTWLKENKPNLKCLVFFTDGYGAFPESSEIHTLWGVTKGGAEKAAFPFGEVVKIGKYAITGEE